MRVALLSYNARSGDAIGNQVAEKFRFFQERGAEVRVFLENDGGLHPAIRHHHALVRCAEPAGEHWDYLAGCDLVIAEYGQYYGLLDLLPLLARGKPRLIVDYHGVTPPALWGPHNRAALEEGVRRRGLVACADVVLVHSRCMARELTQQCGVPASRLVQLGYCVDVPPEQPGRGERLRQMPGLQQATVLLYVGRLAANKRVPVLIEAVHQLRDRRPEVHLLLVGDDRDVYAHEAERCRTLARDLGIADRVHFLGHRVGADLEEAYRAADVFVTASAWESFCVPVVEAMARGVPVVAARATALPETVADGGLTFMADDPADLAAVLRRLLDATTAIPQAAERKRLRVGVVCLQSDAESTSGVERSLGTIAGALRRAGHQVQWLAGQADSPGEAAAGGEDASLTRLPFSAKLFEHVKQCAAALHVLIVGPYLSRLTYQIARQFPDKTLLLPCFHDEPEARLPLWHPAYDTVAGLLFHSEAERALAQAELGFNHPNSVVIGTVLSPLTSAQPSNANSPQPSVRAATVRERGDDRSLTVAALKSPFRTDSERYVVYCGRQTAEKNVPLLLEYARRYSAARPGRFRFVFLGAGNVPIPAAPWASEPGVVSDSEKLRILADADALIHLSCRESLSLAVLEAWQVGTPVIAHANCDVLTDHVARCDGGALVADYASFAQTLDDLWQHSDEWRERGQRGQEFVRSQFECAAAFVARLEQALAEVGRPLAQQLRTSGLRRAQQFTTARWQKRFATAVEQALHSSREEQPLRIEVRRRVACRRVTPGCHTILVPVRVINWASQPALAEGPGRVEIHARLRDAEAGEWLGPATITPLPSIVVPGAKSAAAVALSVPARRGEYEVWFWAQPASLIPPLARGGTGGVLQTLPPPSPPYQGGERNAEPDFSRYTSAMRLIVGDANDASPQSRAMLLGLAEQELSEADRLQHLPEDYLDVTQGTLARLKRKIKQTLLHNFKVAYVDVLSRQQSAFNRQIVNVVRELAECCALLDHAVQQLQAARPRRRRRRLRTKEES